MILKSVRLLNEEEYTKHKSMIPEATNWWWLKTPNLQYNSFVRIIHDDGDLHDCDCICYNGGVRPLCIFNLESTNPIFWYKSEVLVGSKIEYGKYKWTILSIEGCEIHALCDEIIAECCFDRKTNIWEESQLKRWLETIGLGIIQEEK